MAINWMEDVQSRCDPENMLPPSTDPQHALDVLCEYLLGLDTDWHICTSICTKQVNTEIVTQILMKYSKKFKKEYKEYKKSKTKSL